ncbi:FtsX-like permease family protein [Halobacteriota archaeon]
MGSFHNRHQHGVHDAYGAYDQCNGGILGCILGIITATLVSIGVSFYIGMDMPAIITPEVAIGSLAVAILVGVISGLYPARRAAKMSPVEAVRYG